MTKRGQVELTRELVTAARALSYECIEAEAREVARHCFLDFFACTLAGAREPLVDILCSEVASAETASEATLIGRGERATAPTAALINGAAGHALDFDDTHTTMTGHPTVPVLPALLALAEREGASGRDLLAALVAGVETECRLGALMGLPHYAIGFHATATFGTFGAAAACAHLLGLDEDQWLAAIGLAGTQAAGLKSAFGTMAKPLHAGRAASTGLLAALLARRGFSAQAAVIEVAQGFAATHAAPDISGDGLEALSERFLIRDTLFKYHASCYLTHAAIEAASQLRCSLPAATGTSDGSVAPDTSAIESVEVSVSPALFEVCNIESPVTGLEGKFSLRATVALALLGEDTSDPALFCDAKMREPALVALRDRVSVTADNAMAPTRARVSVVAASAPSCADHDSGVPCAGLEIQRERLLAKFEALAAPPLGAARAGELARAALSFDEAVEIEPLVRMAAAGRE